MIFRRVLRTSYFVTVNVFVCIRNNTPVYIETIKSLVGYFMIYLSKLLLVVVSCAQHTPFTLKPTQELAH